MGKQQKQGKISDNPLQIIRGTEAGICRIAKKKHTITWYDTKMCDSISEKSKHAPQ